MYTVIPFLNMSHWQVRRSSSTRSSSKGLNFAKKLLREACRDIAQALEIWPSDGALLAHDSQARRALDDARRAESKHKEKHRERKRRKGGGNCTNSTHSEGGLE